MKNVTERELLSIRSKALLVLLSMLISALILLPLLSSAKGTETGKNAKVYMHPMQTENHAAVTVASVGEGKFALTIESENGVDVYYDEVLRTTENFSKVFDFSNLSDGEYTLNVKSKNETKQLRFGIEKGKVKPYNNAKAAVDFKMEGEKAVFSVANTSRQNYSILIVDEAGTEVYSVVDSSKEIKKVFDFSTAAAGKYRILATSNGNSYTYDFEKK